MCMPENRMSVDKQTLDELRIDRSTSRRGGLSPGLIIGVLAALLVVAAVLWWMNRPKPVPVRTFVVQASSGGGGGNGDRILLNASGYVTARRQATVSSKVTGKVME